MRPEQADDFLLWATLGTVIGGRLGFILLYEPSAVPARSGAHLSRSGRAAWPFTAALSASRIAIVLFARLNKVPLLSLGDLAAAAVPFGLFFGRIANFINGEVYGRLTDMPWGVEFPASRPRTRRRLRAAPSDADLRGLPRRHRPVPHPPLFHPFAAFAEAARASPRACSFSVTAWRGSASNFSSNGIMRSFSPRPIFRKAWSIRCRC